MPRYASTERISTIIFQAHPFRCVRHPIFEETRLGTPSQGVVLSCVFLRHVRLKAVVVCSVSLRVFSPRLRFWRWPENCTSTKTKTRHRCVFPVSPLRVCGTTVTKRVHLLSETCGSNIRLKPDEVTPRHYKRSSNNVAA